MHIKELSTKELETYLLNHQVDLINITTISIAGEGNMNATLRVQNDQGQSIILKQSPPFCEKYPVIPAPETRVLNEAKFYELASADQKAKNLFPKILHVDPKNFIVSMQDLGAGSDFTFVYQNQQMLESDLLFITSALNTIHHTVITDKNALSNMDMRRLNHEYIFCQPLNQDSLSHLDEITPGLSEAAQGIVSHNGYKGIVRELGNIYLGPGSNLCHGDYYPASWLKTGHKISIIDPEFGFIGRAEFDYGVMLAHLILGQQSEKLISTFIDSYKTPSEFDMKKAIQFSGVEIMRRLIGVAQLPLSVDLTQKQSWLDKSLKLVLKGEL